MNAFPALVPSTERAAGRELHAAVTKAPHGHVDIVEVVVRATVRDGVFLDGSRDGERIAERDWVCLLARCCALPDGFGVDDAEPIPNPTHVLSGFLAVSTTCCIIGLGWGRASRAATLAEVATPPAKGKPGP
jgi:hypothetical protein